MSTNLTPRLNHLSEESRRELEELRAQVRAQILARPPQEDLFQPKKADRNRRSRRDPTDTALEMGHTSLLARSEIDNLAWTFYEIRCEIQASWEGARLSRLRRRKQLRRLARLFEDINECNMYIGPHEARDLLDAAQALLGTTLRENERLAEREAKKTSRRQPKQRAHAYKGRESLRGEALRRIAAGDKVSRISSDLDVPARTIRRWRKAAISSPLLGDPPIGRRTNMQTVAPESLLHTKIDRLEGMVEEILEGVAKTVALLQDHFPDDAHVQEAVESFLENALG